MNLITYLLFVSSALISACSGNLDGGSDTNPPYSCDNRFYTSTCADWDANVTKADAEASCDGKVVESRCPRDPAVGICTVPNPKGEGQLTNTYYSNGPEPYTEATAREACASFPSSTFRTP